MADASYIIDIVSEMREGEHTNKELDAITSGLSHAGAESDSFSEALTVLDAQLRRARMSSAGANEALRDATDRYRVLEKNAKQALRTVEKQGVSASQEVLRASQEADEALYMHSLHLRGLEKDAKDAAEAEATLVERQQHLARIEKHVGDRLGRSARRVSVYRGALGDLGGTAGELGERLLTPVQAFVDLREEFGTGAAIATTASFGLAKVADVALKVATAVGLATAALGTYLVVSGDTARTSRLQAEALAAISPEFAAVSGSISKLSDTTGIGEDRLRDLTQQLTDAKVAAADMPRALRAAAVAEAALGQGGAKHFVDGLKTGRDSVSDLAAEIDRKFGRIAEQRFLSLDVQTGKLKKNLLGLSDSLDIEPALRGFQKLVSVFEEGTVTGDALRELMRLFFQPLLDRAEDAGTAFEAFFLGLEIGALKAYLALRDVVGLPDLGSRSTLELLTAAGKGVVYAATAMAGALYAGYRAARLIMSPIKEVFVLFEDLTDIDLTDAFKDIAGSAVDGLVEGLRSGKDLVGRAFRALLGGGVDESKDELGIRSPSRVMREEVGHNAGEGVALGLKDKRSEVDRAMSDLVSPLAERAVVSAQVDRTSMGGARPAAAAPASGPAARAGASISFAGATLNFSGLPGAEAIAPNLADLVTALLEGDVTTMGAA